jgi:hypothetical protein
VTSSNLGTRAAQQLGFPGVEAQPRGGGVFTSCYARFQPEWGVPVAVTVGLPGWFPRGLHEWRTVAPFGLLEITDEAEFRRRYRARLHRLTPKVLRELDELRAMYAPERLILLCFEAPGKWCHRRLLAEWIEQKTGEEVPEL